MNLIKQISLLNSLKLVFIIMITTSVMIFGQGNLQDSNNVKVNEMTDKLVKKLLLTDVQKSSVKSILEEYFQGIQNLSVQGSSVKEVRLKAEKKILNLLDAKQKMKFEIIKEDWWALAVN